MRQCGWIELPVRQRLPGSAADRTRAGGYAHLLTFEAFCQISQYFLANVAKKEAPCQLFVSSRSYNSVNYGNRMTFPFKCDDQGIALGTRDLPNAGLFFLLFFGIKFVQGLQARVQISSIIVIVNPEGFHRRAASISTAVKADKTVNGSHGCTSRSQAASTPAMSLRGSHIHDPKRI